LPVERERVRLHPYLTERILCASAVLAPLGALAAQHHERLDGSGYPRGLQANMLSPSARLLAAADVYQAMLEPRPHRDALPAERAAEELRAEAGDGRLDGDAVVAVLRAAGHEIARRIERPAGDVHEGCERFFRPGYNAHLIAEWLPALDGVVEKLERGALVADVGCGHGASTILMAQSFPNSSFVGADYHDGSIETARRRAEEAGVADRARFRVEAAAAYSGSGYDLVTMFDCLHDMGDPISAARHVHSTLKPDGTWMIVEPNAGDEVEDNLNPVGRAYYAFSTLLCTPASLSQEVGLALGAQAGEARIRNVVEMGGFTRFQRVAQTPFNLVFEARP
jgi:2-polyprenyl-3-methyl-5-hydroxy-6-metoxy-1,4-benzoquinol methylase